nr:hypothetical protein [uncultured Rhodopila sp.]
MTARTVQVSAALPRVSAPPGALVWWGAMLAAAIVLLAPLFAVDIPPLLDYPNHLARLFVLASLPQDPLLSRMYMANWQIIPNLGIDILFTPLMHIMPVNTVGRVMLGFILLLNLAAVAAYHRAVFGSRSLWTAASALVGINGIFLLGFLNFELSQGLAILAAAAWIALHQERPVAAALFGVAAAMALFFCHLMGVLIFLLLIGSAEAALLWPRISKPGLVVAMLRPVAMLLPPVVATLLLYAFSALSQHAGGTGWLGWKDKIVFSLMPFMLNYVFWLDVLTAAVVAGFLAGCLLTRHGRIAPKAVVAIAVLAVAYPFAPNLFKGTGFADIRIPAMIGFLVFAGIRPERFSRRAGILAVSAFAALLLVRMSLVAFVWHAHAADIADVRLAIAPVAPGETVAVISVPNDDRPKPNSLDTTEFPSHWRAVGRRHIGLKDYDPHLASLLVTERRAFWPRLFTDPSQQPLLVRPEYRKFKDRQLPDYEEIVAMLQEKNAGLPEGASKPFCGFDHVLLLDGGAIPDVETLAPDWLRLEVSTKIAGLYRVIGCPAE